MLRNLTQEELLEIRNMRAGVEKFGTGLIRFLLVFPVFFAISNIVMFLCVPCPGPVIALVLDGLFAAGILFLIRLFQTMLYSDMDSLMARDVVIVRQDAVYRDFTLSQSPPACKVLVEDREDPDSRYEVSTGIAFMAWHKPQDAVVLVFDLKGHKFLIDGGGEKCF